MRVVTINTYFYILNKTSSDVCYANHHTNESLMILHSFPDKKTCSQIYHNSCGDF